MTVLVDSDVLIEITRAKNPEILRKWEELSQSEGDILCSPVSVAELWQGALPGEHEMLHNLFRALNCVVVDAETGEKAGHFLRSFRKSHRLELGDALIAAAVVIHGAVLWTRNRKHYPMRAVSFF